MSQYDNDGNLLPKNPSESMIAGRFTINDQVYADGFYFPSIKKDGFFVPFFTKEVSEKILFDLKSLNYLKSWHYNEEADRFEMTYYNGEADEEFEVTASGHYPIGSFIWPWILVY